MNKIFFICIASALLLSGCSSNSDKETESSSEMMTTVAKEHSSEETKDTTEIEVTSENTTTVADIDSKTEIIVTESIEKQSQISDFSDDTVQGELPIMNEENHKSEAKVTAPIIENPRETVTTTVVKSTEPVSTSVQDNVIELPFVPVR